jgi:hypothetical protein
MKRCACACRIWKDEGVGIITRWEPCQVIAKRLHKRQHDPPSGLASNECNLALFEIHRTLCKTRQIAEPLAEIQTEKNEAAPFLILTARF